ncbi:hypothetical protein BGZ73_007803 [Actinomortierella ambigua]|nr:hypothetical protein BGZ73_007803 [Actinomortierella ambigua]
MYYRINSFHRVDQFTLTSTPPAQDELQLYTWKNATLGEIATLVQQAIPNVINQSPQAQQFTNPSSSRRPAAPSQGSGAKYVRLQFRVLSLDRNRATYVARDVGTVYIEPEAPQPAPASQSESSPSFSSPKDQQPNANSNTSADLANLQWVVSTVQPSKALEKTLESISFVTGDLIDIAIMMRSGDQHSRGGGGRPSGVDSGGPGPIGGGGRDRRRRDRDRHSGRNRDDRPSTAGGGSGGGGGGGGAGRISDRFAGRLGALNPDVEGDWKRAQHETYSRR